MTVSKNARTIFIPQLSHSLLLSNPQHSCFIHKMLLFAIFPRNCILRYHYDSLNFYLHTNLIFCLQAIDLDEGDNAKINYYLIGDVKETLTEGLENLAVSPFLVNVETGAVSLNFDPQKGMKGYFDFKVKYIDILFYSFIILEPF